MSVLPTYLFTNTQYSRETRNSTTCPCQSASCPLQCARILELELELKSLVLIFTSLPSPPGRLYELSLSSSAQLLDFLTRKLCLHFDITPFSRQRADHISNWNPTHDLCFDSFLPLRVLPHSLIFTFFFFFLFFSFLYRKKKDHFYHDG